MCVEMLLQFGCYRCLLHGNNSSSNNDDDTHHRMCSRKCNICSLKRRNLCASEAGMPKRFSVPPPPFYLTTPPYHHPSQPPPLPTTTPPYHHPSTPPPSISPLLHLTTTLSPPLHHPFLPPPDRGIEQAHADYSQAHDLPAQHVREGLHQEEE